MNIPNEIILEIIKYLNFSDSISLYNSKLFLNFTNNLLKYIKDEVVTKRDYIYFKKNLKLLKNKPIYINNKFFIYIINNNFFLTEFHLLLKKYNIILTKNNYIELIKANKIDSIYYDLKNKYKVNLKNLRKICYK